MRFAEEPPARSYGKLVIEADLTKAETRRLERTLSNGAATFLFKGIRVKVKNITVGAVGHNIQHVQVEGTA